MKILMILSNLDLTGMTTHTIDLIEALDKQNINISFVVGFDKKNTSDRELKLLRKVSSFKNCKIHTFTPPKRDSKISKLKALFSILFSLVKIKADLIHVQSPYLSWAPWLLRKKFVSTMHVTDIYPSLFYKKATGLIAISKETKEFATKIHNYDEKNIYIVHHGVSSSFAETLTREEISTRREQLKLPTDKLIILLVGSIEKRKGHDILLKAVSKIPENLKEKIHIVFLGSDKNNDTKNTEWLDNCIHSYNLNSIVTRFEYQNPLIFYKISDIFVLPSWQEGFPLVVLEALLSECLCIRSDAEGAYEQIVDGKTGFIFPKGDDESLSKILFRIIEDNVLRSDVKKAGRRFALNYFQSETMAINTIKVYEKVIGCK